MKTKYDIGEEIYCLGLIREEFVEDITCPFCIGEGITYFINGNKVDCPECKGETQIKIRQYSNIWIVDSGKIKDIYIRYYKYDKEIRIEYSLSGTKKQYYHMHNEKDLFKKEDDAIIACKKKNKKEKISRARY